MNYRILILIIISTFICCEGNTSKNNSHQTKENDLVDLKEPDPNCEWCGANEAPEDISWKTIIASKNEPGERMIISGTVYQLDGKTPAPDVVIYVYHTNSEGKYPKKGDEIGNAKRHGYLRGWMKTNEKGQYQFESIRPAAYKTHGGEPAHIHYVIKPPGKEEYWLDALIFSNDARTTGDYLNAERSGGFSHITNLIKTNNGILKGSRNIRIQNFD